VEPEEQFSGVEDREVLRVLLGLLTALIFPEVKPINKLHEAGIF